MKYHIPIIIAAGLLLSGCSLLPSQTSNNGNNQQGNSPTKISMDKKLTLSNQHLQNIPEYVFSQKDLEELDVSHNQISGAIQAEIRQLQNLKILNASNNNMTGVPAEIGQLYTLEVLDLSYNQLTGLPHELGNLKNLKTLNISGNNYSEHDLTIIQEQLPKDIIIIK